MTEAAADHTFPARPADGPEGSAAPPTFRHEAASDYENLVRSVHSLATDLGMDPATVLASPTPSPPPPLTQPMSAFFPSHWIRRPSWASPSSPISTNPRRMTFIPNFRSTQNFPTTTTTTPPPPVFSLPNAANQPLRPPPTVPIPPIPLAARPRMAPELKAAPLKAKWRTKQRRRLSASNSGEVGARFQLPGDAEQQHQHHQANPAAQLGDTSSPTSMPRIGHTRRNSALSSAGVSADGSPVSPMTSRLRSGSIALRSLVHLRLSS
ncbi:hypothetical protein DFJ73DRAFT_856147, partial [Zopfochytrium polystomum]